MDAPLRKEILRSRGYDPAPDGILLFQLRSRTRAG